MAGLNINVGTSVLKREARSIGKVEERLLNEGFTKTGEVGGGRIRYYESAGINVTAVSGPRGTLIMPSGPIRGALFGEDAVGINTTSSIGAGSKTAAEEGKNVRTSGRADQMT